MDSRQPSIILCAECEAFLNIGPFDDAEPQKRCKRSRESIIASALGCRVCALIWSHMLPFGILKKTTSEAVYLTLIRPTAEKVILQAETESDGATWITAGRWEMISREEIPAYLEAKGSDEDPSKYMWSLLGRITFELNNDKPQLSNHSTGLTHRILLGRDSRPVEFFQRFLPQLMDLLNSCGEHERCRIQQTKPKLNPNFFVILPRRIVPALPRRLVRVGNEFGQLNLCLREQIPLNARYLTLSYRWGGDSAVLSKHNIVSWLRSIPEKELPLVIRDAITVCRLMHVEYIWIDALTIIQDDDDHNDWIRESAQMASIYSNSYLNLAASASTSADDGLFRRCNELITDGIPPSFRSSVGNVFTQTTPPWADSGEFDELFSNRGRKISLNMQKSPLYRRGWVLQETYLAPRTLHFTEMAYWFQCKSMVTLGYPRTCPDLVGRRIIPPDHMFAKGLAAGEIRKPDKATMRPVSRVGTHFGVLFLILPIVGLIELLRRQYTHAIILFVVEAGVSFTIRNCDFIYKDEPSVHSLLMDEWHSLCHAYMETDLTVESDRPIAIAGLAQEFSERLRLNGCPSDYYAGLWSRGLIPQMLWRSASDNGVWYHHERLGCPSWSWLYEHQDPRSRHHGIRQISSDETGSMKNYCQILNVETHLRYVDNPFGPVSAGRIQLTAPFFRQTITFNEWSGTRWRRVPSLEMYADVAYKIMDPRVEEVIIDHDLESGARSMDCSKSDQDLMFVILTKGDLNYSKDSFHGLVLQRTPPTYPTPYTDEESATWIRRGTWTECTSHNDITLRRDTRDYIQRAVKTTGKRTVFNIV